MSPFMVHSINFSKLFWEEKRTLQIKQYLEYKKVIRSMIEINSRTFCKQLFKEIKIVTLAHLLYMYIESDMFYKQYRQSL
jgi:hypothetical protein